jgi:hypothetical protein
MVSALLLSAGARPAKEVERAPAEPSLPEQLADALGAARPEKVQTRGVVRPAFPWSPHALALATDGKTVAAWTGGDHADGLALGAACAAALQTNEGFDRALLAAWARAEPAFDRHPAALLAHQWLGLGLAGDQLREMRTEIPLPQGLPSRRARVAWRLLTDRRLAISEPARFWLLGTWAAWALFLDALRALHGLPEAGPVLFPATGDAEADRVADAALGEALPRQGPKAVGAAAVRALGQGAGFLDPPNARLNVRFALAGAVWDVVRLVAWDARAEAEAAESPFDIGDLQAALLECGVWTAKRAVELRPRMRDGRTGAFRGDAPATEAFSRDLDTRLQQAGLLDRLSDGLPLVLDPFGGRT